MEIVKFLFLPIQPFVGHPGRIAMVSGVFIIWFFGVYLLNRKRMQFQHWSLLACAVGWMLFAMWEGHCNIKEYNVRVDLFVIYPFLMGLSVFTVIFNIIKLPLLFRREQD